MLNHRLVESYPGCPPSKKSKNVNISRIARIVLFIATLLAVIATGVLAIVTGTTSISTLSSGALTATVAIVAVIQIYPVLFPSSSSQFVTAILAILLYPSQSGRSTYDPNNDNERAHPGCDKSALPRPWQT